MSGSATLDFTTLDVFTHTRYAGNPLGVVHVPSSATLSKEQRQIIAGEFNLSETVFIHERQVGPDGPEWPVNIHTTARELPFAGHPTIGVACLLASSLEPDQNGDDHSVSATLIVPAGRIKFVYNALERVARLGIPHNYHQHGATLSAAELQKLTPKIAQLPQQSPIVSIVKGMTFALVELQSLDDLTFVNMLTARWPQLQLDTEWDSEPVGMLFYVHQGEGADGATKLRTRMMELEKPSEDPATGSASCCLAAYLALKEGKKGEKVKIEMTQGVEMGRKSDIGIEIGVGQDGKLESVTLSGGAVQVMKGTVIVP
ncbi:Diaminopimelate epimerase-like protein [Rhizodiscina lignyota]|uniref:Diaminopimelate epimerase-like protein n=1 Tax=Rhizodiscina lignyota TaxID=1504668 RepID=A0A9P4ILJ5_9PEZI|nr:Diaminopimelate epimerase-like protein [Rhizodiscina lignyota]